MRLFRRRSSDTKAKQETSDTREVVPGIRIESSGDQGMVTVDLDSFGSEARESLWEEIIKRSGFPLFDGTVEHGYSKRAVGSTDRCPLCGAATQQRNANFIYATDIAPRVMLAPAGYFCTACPTVIIDEKIIATGMRPGYRFRCAVGVDYGDKKHPDYFRTWNGKKPVYVLDENEQIMDLVTEDAVRSHVPQGFRRKDRRKEKQKRKMAERSRMGNWR